MTGTRQSTQARARLLTTISVIIGLMTGSLFMALWRTSSYTTSWGEKLTRRMNWVHVEGETLTQEDLAYIAGMKHLWSLRLNDCNVAECRLPELTFASKDLYSVDLSGTKGLWDLSFLGSLEAETLNLSGCPGVDDISQLNWEALEDLDVSNTDVADLTPAAGSKLNYLRFGHTKVSDLAPLAEVPSLYEVDGSYTQVSSLDPLLDLPSIMRINFEGCPIRRIDGTFACSYLKEVRLAGTNVKSLACLENCDGLKVLDMNDCKRLRGSDWLDPRWCPTLEELCLGGTRVTADDLTWLGKCKALRVLELDGIALRNLDLCRGLTSLEHLSALGCGLTEVSALKKCTALETILLGYNELADGSLDGLPAPQAEWAQTVLDLSHNQLTSAKGLPDGEYRALFLQGNDEHLARTIPSGVSTHDIVADYFFGVDDSVLRNTDRFWQIYLLGVPEEEKQALLDTFMPWYLSCVSEEELLELLEADELNYTIGSNLTRYVAYVRSLTQ